MHVAASETSSEAALHAGVVAVSGLGGQVRRFRVCSADTPESIDHCLRSAFGVPHDTKLLLVDREGLALPLGAGLLSVPGVDGKGRGGPVLGLEVVAERQMCNFALGKAAAKGWRTSDADDGETPRSQPRLPHFPARREASEAALDFEDARTPKSQSGQLAETGGGSSKSSGSHLVKTASSVSLGVLWSGRALDEEKNESAEAELLEVKSVVETIDGTPLACQREGQAWAMIMPEPAQGDEFAAMCSSSSFASQATLGKLQTRDMVSEERRFWSDAAVGFRRANGAWITRSAHSRRRSGGPRKSRSTATLGNIETEDFAMYDSSDQRIDNLFNQWTSNAGKLYPEAVRFRLQDEFGLVLNSAMFAEALARINGNGSTTSAGDEEEMTRDVFKSLWQRLMLGAVCTRRLLSDDEVGTEVDDCQLIEYSEQDMDMLWMTEQQLLFKSPLRIPGRSRVTRRRGYARWVRSSAQSADRLLRLGVKFFLHPIAVSEAVMAARVGMTRIDRYNHQYFVSLEVYAMKHDYASEAPNVDGSVGLVGVEPLEVGPTIVRSVMFLVATGNPDDMHRNWLLSVINNRTQGTDDPLDFFRSDSAAANQVLDGVCLDLESNGRMREYQADFLLYTIIDGAAKEMTPICIAYGHRLRWLQDQLHSKKLALPAQYINEVSSVRLEMQELRQWLGQLKGILKTLSADCKSITQRGNAMPWNFGAHAEGRGKSLLLFLSSTDAHLEQTKDRLNTLDELARSFLEHHQRHREAFNNNILLTLTVATAVFMPAQLLAGIYGTNFVDEDGNPGIPELRWKYGYHYFLLSSVSVIAVGLLLAFVCLRGRG